MQSPISNMLPKIISHQISIIYINVENRGLHENDVVALVVCQRNSNFGWVTQILTNLFYQQLFSCYISHDKNINEVPILFTKMVIIDRYNYNIISCFIYYIRFTNF